MATLISLNTSPISSADPEEALQTILAIRASRLIPKKSRKAASAAKKKKLKTPPKVSKSEAADILKLLSEGNLL